jgi:hypothetical protein
VGFRTELENLIISLKNYQPSLDSYYIVCSFAGGRIAARCSVQIGRTGSDLAGISRPGSIPLEAILQTETAWGVRAAGEPAFYFCQLIPRISLLVFVLVSAALQEKIWLQFNWLWY